MEYILSCFKIKSGKKADTERFLRDLHNNHQSEMRKVLKECGMALDCSFIDGDRLYIFKRLESLNGLKDKIQNSKLRIYNEISKWADECLERREDIEAIAVFDLYEEGTNGQRLGAREK